MSVRGPDSLRPEAAPVDLPGEPTLLETLREIANRPDRFEQDIDRRFGLLPRSLRGWIIARLQNAPGWLDRIDDAANPLADLLTTLLEDGRLDAEDVQQLVNRAADFGQLTDGETKWLTDLVTEQPAVFEPGARAALAAFLGIEDPLAVEAGSGTGGTEATERPSWLPAPEILTRHGLEPDGSETVDRYEGDSWADVGYYPYTGWSGQYTAFAKFQDVFGHGADDGHSWFENYSQPPTGLRRGSAILVGDIRESDFEATAGVDITGSRTINARAYEAVREAGGRDDAQYALFDAEGRPLPFGDGDQLVPMKRIDGGWTEVDRSEPEVTFRIRRADGTIDTEGVGKPFTETIGVESGVRFDLLDAEGRLVPFRPEWGDRIAESFVDREGRWHAIAPRDDGAFDHLSFDGEGKAVRRERIDAASRAQLLEGQEVIHRVLTAADRLRGDGKVNGSYNMSWWGKCHNVAALSSSDMPRPKTGFSVVTNLEPGERLALRIGNDTLLREPDGSYRLERRDEHGTVTGTETLSAEQANALPGLDDAKPVIIAADGSLRQARYTTFRPDDIDALTAHIGDGATRFEGVEGARYYGAPDVITLSDGTEVRGHIASVRTASGRLLDIGKREGFSFRVRDRAPLRAPGLRSFEETDPRLRRRYARSEIGMEALNAYREDDIVELRIVQPDGTERTLSAQDVQTIRWENRLDFDPGRLWKLHETVSENRSTVTETYADTQVWNYATRGVETEPIDPASLPAELRRYADLPGVRAGTTGEDGKYYFRSRIETEGGTEELTYWVRFDAEGNVADYAYLGDPEEVARNVPDFTWRSHVKDPYEGRWVGESQAPGISNDEIRRLYLASQGAFADRMLGSFIAADDLQNAQPVRPEQPATPR